MSDKKRPGTPLAPLDEWARGKVVDLLRRAALMGAKELETLALAMGKRRP
jgi:hypothetical protein